MTYRVVVGVDGSRHSEAALRWALAEARARGGEVTAVFAWQLPFLSLPGAFDRADLERRYRDYVVEIVSAVAPTPPVPLLTVAAEGDPAESLITAAKDADALALGIRRRSPFAGLVLGSVGQRCAAAARCPVVLVKAPDDTDR